MLKLTSKQECCGCQACYEACPSKCITMVADEEGFLYPEIRTADCVDCGLCEKSCPALNIQQEQRGKEPAACYAAYSQNAEERLQSSSGGIFSLLAKTILEQGGVVFGARFDDSYTVFHSYTETGAGLPPFRGSKYAQSDLRGAYTLVRKFLKDNRPVLFSGTPCQIAGLRGFLQGRDNEKLYLVSVVCHGAPSPRVWKEYLNDISGGVQPTLVNMRNKDNGWSRYRMVIQRDEKTLLDMQSTDTPFTKAFLMNLTLRPSCYSCPFRGGHGSDLTLGDFWGIEQVHPEMSDDLGTSLILVYSKKGKQLLSRPDLCLKESRYEDAVKGNPSIIHPAVKPAERTLFWKSFRRKGARALETYTVYNTRTRLRRLWARFVRKIRRG